MRREYAKAFRFEERNRPKLTFSDATKIRMNPETSALELRKQTTTGYYPLDTDLSVTIDAFNPVALTAWLGFHQDPPEVQQPDGTAILFRFSDGTDDRYWDGAAWAVAGPTDWNTEAEVAANFSTFPRGDKLLSVVINLSTTDRKVTPSMAGLCLMMEADFDFVASLVGDSLVPSLRAAFDDMIIDWALVFDMGGTVVSLSDVEHPYNIVTVIEAYDHGADPGHATNLLASYDATQQIVTLSSSVEPGAALWLRLKVEPEIVVNWSSQDYTEVAKLPCVIIDRFSVVGRQNYGLAAVRNIATEETVVLRQPYRVDVELDIVLLAEKNRTLFVMQDFALRHATGSPLLRWRAVDEEVTMTAVDEGRFRPRPNLRDEHSSSYSLTLSDVSLWLQPGETVPTINTVNLTLATAP